MEQYGAAKALLFATPGLAARIINVDDEFGATLAAQASPARLVITTRKEHFGLSEFVRASRVRRESSGLVIRHRVELGRHRVERAADRRFQRRETCSVCSPRCSYWECR